MSVVVAVRKNGRAAIAADSMVSSGSIVTSAKYHSNRSKIHAFESSFIGLVGAVSIGTSLESLLIRHKCKVRLGGRLEIFETFCKLHKILIEEYHMNPHDDDDDEMMSSRVPALIVNRAGIFKLGYDRSVIEQTRFAAIGCGSSVALGAMYALYGRCDDPATIAKVGVEAACEFEFQCGLPLDCHSVVLTPEAAPNVHGKNGNRGRKPKIIAA